MTEKNINAALADRIERVSRQTLLPEIGEAGRDRIFGSVVTVIGAGGLGSPLVLYLAAAGVGEIRLIDLDTVSVSNLSRQVLHTTAEVGEPKVESAARTIARMTAHTRIVPVDAEATQENLVRLLEGADLLIDASDNLATRITASRASLATKVPLLFGSAIRWTGQVGLFNPKKPGAPCFECLFEEDEGANDVKASRVGVASAVTGIVGTIMANEAVKFLAGVPDGLEGRLLMVDALSMDFRTIRLARNPGCRSAALHGD